MYKIPSASNQINTHQTKSAFEPLYFNETKIKTVKILILALVRIHRNQHFNVCLFLNPHPST